MNKEEHRNYTLHKTNEVIRIIKTLKAGDLHTVNSLVSREFMKDKIKIIVSVKGTRLFTDQLMNTYDITELESHVIDEISDNGILTYLNVETKAHKLPLVIIAEFTSYEYIYENAVKKVMSIS